MTSLQSEFSDLISHLLDRLRLKLLVQVEYEERGFLMLQYRARLFKTGLSYKRM